MQTEEPRVVKSHDIHIDTDYANWIAEVKHRYRSAQVKAAVKVNAEKLLFNWGYSVNRKIKPTNSLRVSWLFCIFRCPLCF